MLRGIRATLRELIFAFRGGTISIGYLGSRAPLATPLYQPDKNFHRNFNFDKYVRERSLLPLLSLRRESRKVSRRNSRERKKRHNYN